MSNDYSSMYEGVGGYLLRTPLLPISYRDAILPTEDIYSSVIQEAILVGSASLSASEQRLRSGSLPDKEHSRVLAAARRYTSRMSTRPTPFGLFAAVSMGAFADKTSIVLCRPTRNYKKSEPPMTWQMTQIQRAERVPQVLTALRFTSNPLAVRAGSRVYLPFTDLYCGPDAFHPGSVRHSPLLLEILSLTREGASYSHLLDELQHVWPNIDEPRLQSALLDLLERGLLVSDLHLGPTATYADLSNLLRSFPLTEDIRECLSTVDRLIAAYDASPVGQGNVPFHDLTQALNTPSKSKDRPKRTEIVGVTMGSRPQYSVLNRNIVARASRAAEILLRVNPTTKELPHLVTYREAILERYGQGAEVPILELLDGLLGLGAPATYLHPAPSRKWRVTPTRYPKRDNELIRLATTALRDGCVEVQLSSSQLAELETDRDWRDAIPHSLDLYFSIAAANAQDIDCGNYDLIVGPSAGNNGGGSSLARFHRLLAPKVSEFMTAIANHDQSLDPRFVHVDLAIIAQSSSQGAVSARPALRDAELALGVNHSPGTAVGIDPRDLRVRVHGGRLLIRNSRSGEFLRFFTNTRFNVLHAPNIIRFLWEVSLEGQTRIVPFDWGEAKAFPFLPRVRVGNIVLSPSRWNVVKGAVGESLVSWLCQWNAPKELLLTEGDNRLPIDLGNDHDVAYVERELERRSEIVLEESFISVERSWIEDEDGKLYASEFVTPLVLNSAYSTVSKPGIARTMPPIQGSSQCHLLPGGDCVFMKMYSNNVLHNELLSFYLAPLFAKIRELDMDLVPFFVRYADDDGHIRVRILGSAEILRHKVLPLVFETAHSAVQSQLAFRIAFDTYDREVDRYGGISTISIAEQVFAADSEFALTALRTGVPSSISERRVLATAVNYVYLMSWSQCFSWSHGDLRELLDAYTIDVGKESRLRMNRKFRDIRPTVMRFVQNYPAPLESLGDRMGLALSSLESSLRPLFREFHQAHESEGLACMPQELVMSMMHMSNNRLFGIDHQFEHEALYMTMKTIDSIEVLARNGIRHEF